MTEQPFGGQIAALRADTTSGATAIVLEAIRILRVAVADAPDRMESIAEALCRAQPSMAGLRTARRIARQSSEPAAALDRLAQQVARAPAAIARHAAAILSLSAPRTGASAGAPPAFVTCSRSAAVEATFRRLSAMDSRFTVYCAESRPALEGRALAVRLAHLGVSTTVTTDAGLSAAVKAATAVLVGADAVGPGAFINKVGTGAICGLAAGIGVPVYVLAGREKLLNQQDFEALRLGSGSPHDVWADPPPGVGVENPLFEFVPMSFVVQVVSDAGPII